jgi:LysR family hca operon transcriptional activator
MQLRLLRYFIAVSEELSFTRAAEHLNIAQPSLSQQIRQLEGLIGTPLFTRNKHRIELTEAGRVFQREARNILAAMNHAVDLARKAARAEAGVMTIALVPGPEDKMFSTVFTRLLRNYPNLQIVLRSLTSPEQVTALKKGEINVGFLRGPIEDKDLGSKVIVREDVIVLLPARHALARQKRIPVRKLANVPLLHVSRNVAPALHDMINQVAADAGVTFRTILEMESLTAILNAVASGLGFSLHGEYVRRIAPKDVAVRELDANPLPKLELVVAYRKDDKLPALAAFLDLLRKLHRLP